MRTLFIGLVALTLSAGCALQPASGDDNAASEGTGLQGGEAAASAGGAQRGTDRAAVADRQMVNMGDGCGPNVPCVQPVPLPWLIAQPAPAGQPPNPDQGSSSGGNPVQGPSAGGGGASTGTQ